MYLAYLEYYEESCTNWIISDKQLITTTPFYCNIYTLSEIKHMELKSSVVNENCTLVFQNLIHVLPSAHTVY